MIATNQSLRDKLPFLALGAVSFVIAMTAGWTAIASQIDNYHSDWVQRIYKPSQPAKHAMILEIDDATLQRYKGISNLRETMARALEIVAKAQPKAVAMDVLLAEESVAPGQDQRLAAALAATPNLVLPTDIMNDGSRWEEPYSPFLPAAKAVGHVHADPDRNDGASRQVQLEKVAGRKRYWALALEAYRLALGADAIIESPKDLQIKDQVVPAARKANEGRAMLIRYRSEPIPRLSLKQVIENPKAAGAFRGKVVFVGVTSQTQARDRLVTPVSTSTPMPGVEIHAHIYETLAQRDFLRKASNVAVVVVCIVLTATTTLIFVFLGGWQSYLAGGLQILMAQAFPHILYGEGVVFPLLAPAGCAWLTGFSCAAFEYFVVRIRLREAEAARRRYQDAIRMVVHEMKQPLTAIQGSSELMSRYNLNDDKRKQMSLMINSESKRMRQMLETFLNVERLNEGQMQMKREVIVLQSLVDNCIERTRPQADKKRIAIVRGEQDPGEISGDRELMECAIYNLLTNAIKYSPAETQVHVDTRRAGEHLRVSVRDQGIGMDEKDLKKVGTKFYRTSRAEKSGEEGTGIGLSFVREIVDHHRGKVEITSALNQGSCFTIVVPVWEVRKSADVRG